jgi:ribosomal protein L37AE/L43A
MYITDLSHFLDNIGTIGPKKGPALVFAQFLTNVVAHASSVEGQGVLAPTCFKCKKFTIEATVAKDGAVVWACPRCNVEGRISNWQASLWDLRDRPVSLS